MVEETEGEEVPMSLKVRTKLILAFLVMLIPFFIFMIINLSIQRAVHESFHKVKKISGEIQTLGNLQVAIGKGLMPVNDYMITGDRRYIKEFERASAFLENQLRSADEILSRLKVYPGLDPDELKEEEEILKSVKTAWANIKDLSLKIFAIPDPVGSRTAAGLMEEMDYKWAYPAVEQLGRWREIDREEYREAEETADRAWRHGLIIMAAGITILAFLGISFSFFLSRLFAMPIRELQEGVEALAGGNLDYRLSIPARGDEIGQLARGFNMMAERLNESTEALRESEANLNKAQAVAHIGSWFLDVTKNELFWSDETYRMFVVLKGTPLTYEKFLGIVHPDDREYVDRKWTAALNKQPYDIEHRIIVDGKLRWVRERAEVEFNEEGEAVKGIGTVQDITEIKRIEEQFRHAQKMESVGQLAGGIAHDFNNLLTSILGYSVLALIDLPEDHPLREILGIIKGSAEKAAELTRQILAFSRKQVLDMKVVNLNTVVEQMGKMLQRVIAENIVIDLKTQSPIKNIMADAGQIEQVLMNLVINARDAMPGGGCLTIETADVRLDRNYAQRHESVQRPVLT